MAKLLWDQDGQRLYETGVNQGVLFVKTGAYYGKGIAWNGLTAVTESPSGAESTPLYADNVKYLNLLSNEEFGATVEAYTYPDEFGVCDGSSALTAGVTIGQQGRKSFALAYKTVVGNDTDGTNFGYKIHLIYGASAAPSEKAYATVNESPEAITFSWELSTVAVNVTGHKPTASLTIDSTKEDPAKMTLLENILYGTASIDARIPMPDEVAAIFTNAAPSALTLSSSVPADSATAVVASANIVLTFNNKIEDEQITLMSAAGVFVPFSKSWDITGKILTIDPDATLAAATMHYINVIGVNDIYSQSLAPTCKKFTTV